jgi:ketosteroid isomerase-like protein
VRSTARESDGIEGLARKVTEAFNAADVAGIERLIHRDAEIQVTGTQTILRGRHEIVAWVEDTKHTFNQGIVAHVESLAGGTAGIVLGRSIRDEPPTALGPTARANHYVVWLIEERDGMLWRVRQFDNRLAAYRAFSRESRSLDSRRPASLV